MNDTFLNKHRRVAAENRERDKARTIDRWKAVAARFSFRHCPIPITLLVQPNQDGIDGIELHVCLSSADHETGEPAKRGLSHFATDEQANQTTDVELLEIIADTMRSAWNLEIREFTRVDDKVFNDLHDDRAARKQRRGGERPHRQGSRQGHRRLHRRVDPSRSEGQSALASQARSRAQAEEGMVIEKMNFAAAYAHDFMRRSDAGVMESDRQRKPPFKNEGAMIAIAKWESSSAARSSASANGAVARQSRTSDETLLRELRRTRWGDGCYIFGPRAAIVAATFKEREGRFGV